MVDHIEIDSPQLLLVEGGDELEFFKGLIQTMDKIESSEIQIMSVGGETNYGSFIKTLTLSPDFESVRSICISRDAHANPGYALDSTKGILNSQSLPSPDNAFEIMTGSIEIAIMIIPSAEEEGELEDLCLSAVSDYPEMDCVEYLFDCIDGETEVWPNDLNKSKAQAFLATQEKTCKTVGRGGLKRLWNFDANEYDDIKDTLSTIFS